MQKLYLAIVVLLLCGSSSRLNPQSCFQAAALLDYIGISQTNTENVGVGGRFGVRIHRRAILEAESTYSYGVNSTEVYRNIANGDAQAIARTSIGVTDGLFGPMLQPSRGHLRPFVTLKAGFIDFRLSPSLIPYSGVASSLLGLRTSRVNPELYPGAGAEANLGPVGLRLEFGDALYFNSGAHNNLRITFGPTLRF
jgi:hypothetical protein